MNYYEPMTINAIQTLMAEFQTQMAQTNDHTERIEIGTALMWLDSEWHDIHHGIEYNVGSTLLTTA